MKDAPLPASRHDKCPMHPVVKTRKKQNDSDGDEENDNNNEQKKNKKEGSVAINMGCLPGELDGCMDDNFCIEVILAAFDFFRVSETKQD